MEPFITCATKDYSMVFDGVFEFVSPLCIIHKVGNEESELAAVSVLKKPFRKKSTDISVH